MPFKVAHGRLPVLPADISLGVREKLELRDVTNAYDYAEETAFALQTTIDRVARQLGVTREKMKRHHDKSTHVNDFAAGEKVWIKRKYYRTVENKKLSPRKDGPYTIVSKLPNGVNFHIKNDASRKERIVHHDRMVPARISADNAVPVTIDLPPNNPSTENISSYDSDSDSSSYESAEEEPAERRYPRRNRTQRSVPGSIPWNSISTSEI